MRKKKNTENKLTLSSIKILKETLKAPSGFILIYNKDKRKILHLWNDFCSHEAKSLLKDVIIEMEELERAEDDGSSEIEPEKLVN